MKKDIPTQLPTSMPPEHLAVLTKPQLETLMRLVKSDDYKFFVENVLAPEKQRILEAIADRTATGCSGNYSDSDYIKLGENRGQLNFIKYLRSLELGVKRTLEVKQKLTAKQ